MFEAEKMLKMVLTQARVINNNWKIHGIEQMVTTQTNIDSYLEEPNQIAEAPIKLGNIIVSSLAPWEYD